MGRRQGPYYHRQVELGAQFVDRIGYDAPYIISGTEAEHMATRTAAGLYDVYHQGPVDIKGRDAEALLQRVMVNDITRVGDGQVLYSSVCNPEGGIIDDLTVYRLSAEHFWLCPTPTRVDAITAWVTEQARGMTAYVTNIVSGTAFLSIQGPNARTILSKMTSVDLASESMPYYTFAWGDVAEVPSMIARTGYSGELGFELFFPREYGEYMWDSAVAAGADHGLVPCGLGALRSCRIEKKYPLYGLDLTTETTPLEGGLGWTVRFGRGDFIGKEALQRQKEAGVTRSLLSIEFPDLSFLPKTGDAVTLDGEPVGKVTSADPGFFVRKTVALAYLRTDVAPGTTVTVTTAVGATSNGVVSNKAAYDPDRERVRG